MNQTALAWTTQKPTQPGFYWSRVDDSVDVERIVRRNGRLIVQKHESERFLDDHFYSRYEWAGPLEVPK